MRQTTLTSRDVVGVEQNNNINEWALFDKNEICLLHNSPPCDLIREQNPEGVWVSGHDILSEWSLKNQKKEV